MTKKILFISHDASRTGAPILLLNFLRWFKENTDIPFQILLVNGGDLESQFRELAPVWLYTPEFSLRSKTAEKILTRLNLYSREQRLKAYREPLVKQLSQNNIGLIYANTITVGDALAALSSLNCPVICHVHELEYWIRYRTGINKFNKLKNHTDRFISVSQAVKKNLMENHHIDESIIDISYPFVPIKFHDKVEVGKHRKEILKSLDIPENAKIICASGTLDWRKSPDIFILLAKSVIQKYPQEPVYFIWIGGTTQGDYFNQLWYDVKKLELEKFVRFLGVQANPIEYFSVCDIFVLTSREDPFPLVCLEAASLGKPIICFDKAGGEKEFVEDDCGFVVPYLDIEMMADKIIALLKSPNLCCLLGEQAQQKVTQKYDIDNNALTTLQIIKKLL